MVQSDKQHILTSEQRKNKILNGEPLPLSFVTASKKRQYIVNAYGTIFGREKQGKRDDLFPKKSKMHSIWDKIKRG